MIIRRATEGDLPEVARLCWAYRDFLGTRAAHVPGFVESCYAQDEYAALIDRLPEIHARPRGDLLVVDLNGRVSGCAMYYPLSAQLCEIKRIYLDDQARGTGAASALVREGIRRAAADGYARMVLDTIHTLHEAIVLYERLGFRSCAPFYEPDPAYAETLRFFDYPLNRSAP